MISCRPIIYLESLCVFFLAVYIPPTLTEVFSAISKQENAHPEVALIVAGDFNSGKLKSVLPNFYQYVKMCNQRGKKLWTTFTPHTETRTKLSLALHLENLTIILSSWFLLTSKNESRQHQWLEQRWSDEADANLQDCLVSTDWDMFWDSSNGIEYATSVTAFINKCIDDIIPTVTVCTYPKQKQWITGNIHIELKARAVPLSRSATLIRTLIRNPAMPSDEPSNKHSINTGLRLNHTTPALTLVGCFIYLFYLYLTRQVS